jgi:hypothetical protein
MNASSDVWPGGQILFTVQFETYLNSGQACAASDVTIGIAAADGGTGTGTPLATTSTGVLGGGVEGLYNYTWSPATDVAPGDYLVTWTGVRASDAATVAYVQVCTVAAVPAPSPAPGVYATYAQYVAEIGDTWTPQAIVSAALRKASKDIDRALIAAVYRTDADGMPQDAVVADTIMRATCAQAEYRVAHMDPAGVKFEYGSSNVGGVSVSRSPAMTGIAFYPIAPDALSILHVDGVLPAAPLVNW